MEGKEEGVTGIIKTRGVLSNQAADAVSTLLG